MNSLKKVSFLIQNIISRFIKCIERWFIFNCDIMKLLIQFLGIQNPVSKQMYIQLNEKIENLTKVVFVAFVPLTILSVFLPPFFMTFFNYFTVDSQDVFDLPFYTMYDQLCWIPEEKTDINLWRVFFFRYPFEWKSPIGYLAAYFCQLTGTFCCNLTSTTVVTLFIGSCWLDSAFIEDITNNLSLLNKSNANNSGDRTKKDIFRDIIQFHVDIRRLSTINNQFIQFQSIIIFKSRWIFFLLLQINGKDQLHSWTYCDSSPNLVSFDNM